MRRRPSQSAHDIPGEQNKFEQDDHPDRSVLRKIVIAGMLASQMRKGARGKDARGRLVTVPPQIISSKKS